MATVRDNAEFDEASGRGESGRIASD